MAKNVIERLRGGDRRSIGQAGRVAALATRDPKIFRQLIEALWHADPIIRMRAADAAEKASSEKPALLCRYKRELLGLLAEAEATPPELRWHLAQMIPRLKLSHAENERAAAALRLYMRDRSSIVRTFAMQALAELATTDETLYAEVKELVCQAVKTGSAAMRARGRKLLKQMERE